jgi:Tfp pilus assembly protein PilO
MNSSTRPIVAIVVVAALAIAFWVLALGPKREQADELGQQVTELSSVVETARSELIAATQAKRAFPADYRQLVTLGQAAPSGDETASLLVELEQIATESKVKFNSIQLEGSGEGSTAAATATSSGSLTGAPGATAPPTEVAASLLPLGASIGPAGLAVMPYSLDFSGGFFQVADFINRIDSLVKPNRSRVAVDGRLVTIDGFSLSADTKVGFPHLSATFSITTYLAAPELGITAGATPSTTAPPAATPTASEAPTATAEPASATVSAR